MSQFMASGFLEITPRGFGFLRTAANSFQPSDRDVFVPAPLIQKWGLRQGSEVTGWAAANGHRKARGSQLARIEAADGLDLEAYRRLPDFAQLTSVNPFERIRIDGTNDLSLRVIDLISPIGKGQRGLIVAPPRTGKTMLLQKLAQAISTCHPEIQLLIVLIDERPEEVTDMQRLKAGEVVPSSADRPATQHVRVAEMVLHRARRLVESGRDVVILLDSITRLARAYNTVHKGNSRTLSGGLGAGSMTKPREFFGAARKIEEGGSLTILATALIDTGSRMDDVIFEEFKGTGNLELVLHRGLADKRIWPAVDIRLSGTRREEQLRDPVTQRRVDLLRRALSGLDPEKAMAALLKKLGSTPDNATFLESLDRVQGS